MKTRIIALVLIIASFAFVIGSIFIGSSRTKSNEITTDEEVIPGYTQIDSVQGVSFYVDSNFIDKATAITQISDNVSFQKNQFYSYKNGIDKYILFNIENLIVVAQKGTDFWIESAADKPYALENTSMMNIWFSQGSKKFDSSTKDGITTTIANAGVSINSKTYNDFCGKLININKDGEEWSLFVGVPGVRYDKLSDSSHNGIDNIVNTFKFSNSSGLLSQDIYAVSLNGNDTKHIVETETIVIEEDDSLSLSNQNAVADKDDETAYTSTPYNMLLVGDNGLFSVFNDYKSSYEEAIICPKNVYRGEEAKKIIMDYCSTTEKYNYFEAPEGSQWEVIEYNLNYRNCENDDYANIKLKGLDGEVLKYRGIKYSARTYDITYKTKENGDWIEHYYTYYAVPNGCYEYCLEVGERKSVTKDEVNAAYYHIKNENYVPDKNITINPELAEEISDEKEVKENSNNENNEE